MNLDLYRKLFVHRHDVFAEQHPDGSYRPVKRELTSDDIAEHLGGMTSYGVYVIKPQPDDEVEAEKYGANTVTWACFDLDTYDEDALAFLCRQVQHLVYPMVEGLVHENEAVEYPCLLLENSGGKGFHIWLFFAEPVGAARVRHWTEQVREAYNLASPKFNPRDANCDAWPPLEIFPKQDYVAEGGFGNLVKLPFGIHAKSGKRSKIVGCEGWASTVDSVQGLNTDFIPALPEGAGRTPGEGKARTAPFPCVAKLIEDGAPQGMRDNAMFHFCHYACGTGLPEDLVQDWAERVNENFDPPLSDFEVEKSVHSASGMAAPHPGCKADWLKGFCPGGEGCYAPWNKREEPERPQRPQRREPQATPYMNMSREERRAALAQRRKERG